MASREGENDIVFPHLLQDKKPKSSCNKSFKNQSVIGSLNRKTNTSNFYILV